VDVYQTENDIIVKAEMPGVSKEDLNVYVEDNLLRLSGRTRRHEEFKDEHCIQDRKTILAVFPGQSHCLRLLPCR
jgi:HSP20 family protein